MRVKINKVLPFKQNSSKTKGQPFIIAKSQYILSSSRLDQKNFTGFPVFLQLICTLPDATIDYDYARFQITAQSADYKEIIAKKTQKFDDIKKGQHKRDFVFTFTPIKKGLYTIKVEAFYKPRYFVNTNQQPDQRRQGVQQSIKFQQPFDISELFVTSDKSTSITFPLLIQHTIQSKNTDQVLDYSISFSSENFELKLLNDKSQFKLKNGQIFSTILSVKPYHLKKFLDQKYKFIGQLIIKYGLKGETSRKINLRANDKFIFFKATTLKKQIPKKDIVQVTVRFQKKFNVNFNLGDLTIVIDQSLMEGIKIVKTSKGKINLQKKTHEDVIFSIICLKSGFFHIRALNLITTDNKTVNYVNDITLFVENEQQHKAQVFQNTTVIQIQQQESLI